MSLSIDALNEEMIAAGLRIFAGGLHPASNAKSLRAQPDGQVRITVERILDIGNLLHPRHHCRAGSCFRFADHRALRENLEVAVLPSFEE